MSEKQNTDDSKAPEMAATTDFAGVTDGENPPGLPARLMKVGPFDVVRNLSSAFGWRFVGILMLVFFLVKGVALQGLTLVMLPYFKKYAASGSDYQRYYNVAMMAFSLKPLVAIISDSKACFGYHKRYYVCVLLAMGVPALAIPGILPVEKASGPIAAALFFIATLSVAGCDVLLEGKYSELMIKHLGTGTQVVSMVWVCVMAGGAVATAFEGPLADHSDVRFVLFTLASMFFVPFVPTLLGWIPEVPRRSRNCPAGEYVAVEESRFGMDTIKPAEFSVDEGAPAKPHRGLSVLAVVCGFIAIGMAVISLYSTHVMLIAFAVPMMAAVLIATFRVLPRVAAMANLFMFFKELCYLQINGILDYFYTSDDTCVPGGPAFSFTYYQTFSSIVGNVAALVGSMAFQRFLSKWTFRHVFWLTTAIKVGASVFDVTIVKRWNVAIHIPDHVAYLCGDAIVTQIAWMLDFMPAAVLISRLCPKGRESTMYALMAGFSGLGQTISRALGYIVATEVFKISTVEPCHFDNLPYLIIAGHLLLPLTIIPLATLLIENRSMNDAVEEKDIAVR